MHLSGTAFVPWLTIHYFDVTGTDKFGKKGRVVYLVCGFVLDPGSDNVLLYAEYTLDHSQKDRVLHSLVYR